MEQSIRKSSLKSNRKPLSDCTNTRQNHLQSSKLVTQKTLTLINKPSRKPPIVAPNTVNTTVLKNNQNPNLNLNVSTGSNNSPVSDVIPPRPVTPNSHAGDKVYRKSGNSATLTQRQGEQTKKHKGKSVRTTPPVQGSAHLTPCVVENQISSSAVFGDGGHVTIPCAVETNEVDERIRKGKAKLGVETPTMHMSVGTTAPAQRSTYSASRGVHISSSAISGDAGHVSRPYAVENREIDEQIRKDKGKTVVETPTPLMTSSSAASGDCCLPGPSEIDEHRRLDKGKMVVETPIMHISSPSHTLQTSSSAASGNHYLPGPSALHIHEKNTHAKKADRKINQESPNGPNLQASDPVTPRFLRSSSAASGTENQQKTGLIVYNQKRRTSQRKKVAVGPISLPFSCPPGKRTRKNGMELDGKGGDSYPGSYTDPLPLHKKKRSKKESMHAMWEEEVKKLRKDFDEIDNFDLKEEVASESELE